MASAVQRWLTLTTSSKKYSQICADLWNGSDWFFPLISKERISATNLKSLQVVDNE